MLSHDREVWYLYNGFLMDDVGDCMQGQPHAFHSLNDAKEWAAQKDFDIEIKAGTRKGDTIVKKLNACPCAAGRPEECLEHSQEADDIPPCDDEIKFCPNCEKPNQFGELCNYCRAEQDEQAHAW